MSNAQIRVRNTDFSYDDNRQIFRDLNIDFESGFISITGPNGSGKSTLFKLLTGLEKASSGTIEIGGKEINSISPLEKAKLFTAIHQNQEFTFPFTCIEFVALGRYPYRKGFGGLSEEDYKYVIDAMRETDTLKYKDKLITELSGGEKQRVHIASAICQNTDIIFLDEAMSALDISHKAYMLKLLKTKAERDGKMIIAVMHDLNMAYRYSDKVCMMKDGEVLYYDTPVNAMTVANIKAVFDIDVDLIPGKGFFVNI